MESELSGSQARLVEAAGDPVVGLGLWAPFEGIGSFSGKGTQLRLGWMGRSASGWKVTPELLPMEDSSDCSGTCRLSWAKGQLSPM